MKKIFVTSVLFVLALGLLISGNESENKISYLLGAISSGLFFLFLLSDLISEFLVVKAKGMSLKTKSINKDIKHSIHKSEIPFYKSPSVKTSDETDNELANYSFLNIQTKLSEVKKGEEKQGATNLEFELNKFFEKNT
ncbi:MAG: hypothetical protein HOO06_01015 [Bdellovibrionaceae bacterium]|jgi:hypothetical protein|nr:hypothetical protein [Pseudobdellovibrionaceae bacterium]